MNEGLVFPDTADALISLLDGSQHVGEVVTAVTHLQADGNGLLVGPFPLVHITALPGNQGFIDRAERATLDVYAPGQQAKRVLTSIVAFLVGSQIETSAGFIDEIACPVTPADVPYASDTLNLASAQLEVIARPIS